MPLALISGFACGWLTESVFDVGAGQLARLGCGVNLAKSRSTRRRWLFDGGVGCFASTAVSVDGLRGRHVRVINLRTEVAVEQVSASLDLDAAFCIPEISELHCWHALRLHHRSRLLFGDESCCERGAVCYTNFGTESQDCARTAWWRDC